MNIRPQSGPQEVFGSSHADIAIIGGAAFAGKTFSLLLEPLRYLNAQGVTAVIFRRTQQQIRKPGGMWDEARKLYPLFGLTPMGSLEFRRPDGWTLVKLDGLEYEDDVYNFDSAQLPLICFDQLESFTWFQFFYLLGRNRDPSGKVKPYVRAACNPDPDSWLAKFIEWWIDQETGYPIPERSGVLRWFVRYQDVLYWADSTAELVQRFGADASPKSVTFIPGTIYDNKIGMAKDPDYIANLKALPLVQRERLLGGNWKIRAKPGLLFRREWLKPLDVPPSHLIKVRYWDLAATEATESNNPAWTVGVQLGKYLHHNRYVILDVRRMQVSPKKVEEAIKNMAGADGTETRIGLPQDPGQAGKAQVSYLVGQLAGYTATAKPETGDKLTRFGPFSAQCEHGNVDYVKGPWNDVYFAALEGLSEDCKIGLDDADASSGAFNMLVRAGAVDLKDAGPVGKETDDVEPWMSPSGSVQDMDSPWGLR